MENLLNAGAVLPPQVWGISSISAVLGMTTLLVFLLAWSLVWKGLALWKAARASSKVWFVILLLVNTLGILEIIYLFLVNNKKK